MNRREFFLALSGNGLDPSNSPWDNLLKDPLFGKMDRRDFLAFTVAFTATCMMDWDRQLWVPSEKTIFLPNESIYKVGMMFYKDGTLYERVGVIGEVDEMWVRSIYNPMRMQFEHSKNNIHSLWQPDLTWQRVNFQVLNKLKLRLTDLT